MMIGDPGILWNAADRSEIKVDMDDIMWTKGAGVSDVVDILGMYVWLMEDRRVVVLLLD